MRLAPLHGGMVGEVYGADLADDERVVVKVDRRDEPQLTKEGMMLRYLGEKSDLPVPAVLHCEEALLIMTFLPGVSQFDSAAEEHVAALLADHGFERVSVRAGTEAAGRFYAAQGFVAVSHPTRTHILL